MDSNRINRIARLMGGRTRARTKVLPALAIAGMFAIIPATAVLSADLVGRVANETGQPVAGVQVSAVDSTGASAGSVVSDAEGSYEIQGLKPGAYRLMLKGQTVVSYVPKEGLTVNWGLSKTAPPLAIAKLGASSMDTKVSKSK
ncbi:MAG TPA: carboxypeptidase-like regulatory domain-containing protein [Steroidobacteraceae bacterium]|nr:carboxypeptidase-like regulatory domain-containing protein [Steroidobacteraceae bacterium]